MRRLQRGVGSVGLRFNCFRRLLCPLGGVDLVARSNNTRQKEPVGSHSFSRSSDPRARLSMSYCRNVVVFLVSITGRYPAKERRLFLGNLTKIQYSNSHNNKSGEHRTLKYVQSVRRYSLPSEYNSVHRYQGVSLASSTRGVRLKVV